MTKEEALNPKPHEKIAHLSEDEIVTVMEQYHSGKKVTEIIETFNIQVNKNKLSYLFPPNVITEIECPYCELPYWKVSPPRSSNTKYVVYCPNCNHQVSNPCLCINCQNNTKQLMFLKQELKREKIKQFIKPNMFDFVDFVDYGNLNFIQKTYLGALLMARLSEDMSTINPFYSLGKPVSPTIKLNEEILKVLLNSRIMKISIQASLDEFHRKKGGQIVFNYFKVSFCLNVKPSDGDHAKMIDSLINPVQQNGNNSEEILALWKKIAFNECIEYLLFKMDYYGFDFNPGKQTFSLFENLLTHFSTSQVYRIIWHSFKKSIAYRENKKITKEHTASSVIWNCESYGKKAIEEKWELKSFNRENKIPQSALSEHFYDKILGIGDKGFYQIPGILDPDENNFNVA